MSESTWMDDPDARAWAQHVLDSTVPMIEQSKLTVSLIPTGQSDVKFAVELGLSIMFNKPIIAVVAPGQRVPRKLRAVVDHIVECDLDDETSKQRLAKAIQHVLDEEPPTTLALLPHLTSSELRVMIAALKRYETAPEIHGEPAVQIVGSLLTAAHEALYSLDRGDL